MCTDKTLKAKIKRFNELTEIMNTAKNERDKLSTAIIAAMIEREHNTTKDELKNKFGVMRVSFEKDSIKAAAVKEHAPIVWNAYGKTTTIEYIRKA